MTVVVNWHSWVLGEKRRRAAAKTRGVCLRLPNNAKRPGVRQPSGALRWGNALRDFCMPMSNDRYLLSLCGFGFNRSNRSTNRKNTPGPKQSSMTEMPVAMPQNVPRGAQQSPRRRTMMWLGTATSSSRMLPRRSQRGAAFQQRVRVVGSGEAAKDDRPDEPERQHR